MLKWLLTVESPIHACMLLVGVKQGCVIAPVIFNLFLAAVTLACRNGLPFPL